MLAEYILILLFVAIWAWWIRPTFTLLRPPESKRADRVDYEKIHHIEHELGLPQSDYTAQGVGYQDFSAPVIEETDRVIASLERALNPEQATLDDLNRTVMGAFAIPPPSLGEFGYDWSMYRNDQGRDLACQCKSGYHVQPMDEPYPVVIQTCTRCQSHAL